MFKKKFFSILLALFAVVLLPSFALAQTSDNETIYEDTSIEYDFEWDNYDESYDTSYDLSDEEAAAIGSLVSGFAMVWVVFSSILSIGIYVYTSLAYMKIAQKLNHPNPWFAWVPILNIVLHFQLAEMSGWFVLLMLVPLANIIVYVMAMMKICERRGSDKLLGLLVLVPLANYILLGILAWKKEEDSSSTPPQQSAQQAPVQQPPQQEQPVQQAPQQPPQKTQAEEEESYLRPPQKPEPPTGA